MDDRVMCRSDHEYAQHPLAMDWHGQHLVIIEILGEWRTPEGKHFLVRTQEQGTFDLFYHDANDQWSIQQH